MGEGRGEVVEGMGGEEKQPKCIVNEKINNKK